MDNEWFIKWFACIIYLSIPIPHHMAFPCDEAVPCLGPLAGSLQLGCCRGHGRPAVQRNPRCCNAPHFCPTFVHSWHLSKMSSSIVRAPKVSIKTIKTVFTSLADLKLLKSSLITWNLWRCAMTCHVGLPEATRFFQGLVLLGSLMHHLIRVVQWSHGRRGMILTRHWGPFWIWWTLVLTLVSRPQQGMLNLKLSQTHISSDSVCGWWIPFF